MVQTKDFILQFLVRVKNDHTIIVLIWEWKGS